MDRIPFLGATIERLDLETPPTSGPLPPAAARAIVGKLNADRSPGDRQPLPGELLALSLLHEVAHLAIEEASRRQPEVAFEAALPAITEAVGPRPTTALLGSFADAFPGLDREAAARLEDLVLVHLANVNPAADPLRDLVDESGLPSKTLKQTIAALERHQAGVALDDDGPGGGISLLDLLREPARQSPESLAGQLRYVRDHWGWLLGSALDGLAAQIDVAIGILTEEQRGLHQRFGGGGGGGGEAPTFVGAEAEVERFSEDREWMPRIVLLAKSTYVWLDQLSRRYGREIRTLDAIPDEELAEIARQGITGLWLIGLWQRSKASERIKRWRGNTEAVASAYSLDDYRIADDLGGEDGLARLREMAWRHGIRLASDMVPNHMGIDSRWVIEHPERFIQLPEPPFPAYRFEGANLADDPRVEIRLEDHYWDDTDAAVVFERRDTATGERRYIYHGNDGTSFPWNDTAQLDFLKAEVREVVIRTILDVAHRFPVIRFDAAMVLAKKHVERLWYPEPGAGGGIPSRAEYGAMPKREFDKLMPTEFWRDVVDRVAAEAPDTLLLAEAFWLLEGYFVRTLGMHRVYNSAFMHMIRDEDNAGYRKVIRDTIEFDPAILGRYVNFLTNPDEETAIEQFGTGEKYFGAATLLATLPGLPMIGHGQLEGFTEKYGMEFQRARLDERPNEGLGAYFDAQIVPLLRERGRFAGSADFRLYDLVGDGGANDDVFAYSNGRGGERSLIAYHNRFGSAAGWIRESAAFAEKDADGSKTMRRDTLADALGLAAPDDGWLRIRDRRAGRETLRSVGEIRARGLFVQLEAYGCLVLDELNEVVSTADEPWSALGAELAGAWVPSLDDALANLRLRPVHERAAAAIRESDVPGTAGRLAATIPGLDRSMFDALRLATPLRRGGFDDVAVRRTRLAIGLPHPSSVPDAASLAEAWLDDADVAAFLEVHDWEGRTYFSAERWTELLELAAALDRVQGATRTSPAIEVLRVAAVRAGFDVHRLRQELGGSSPAPRRPDITAVPTLDRSVSLGDGRRLAYAEWGRASGRPVFLLHGMPGSRLLCPDVSVTEAAGVRLVSPDRPGYGGSDPQPGRRIVDGAADVAALATALGIERFDVVGWSSGGPYALACGAMIADRVGSVASVAGDAPAEEFPELLDELSPEARARIAAVLRGDASAVADLEARMGRFAANPGAVFDGVDADSPDGRMMADAGYREAMVTMMGEAFRQGVAGFRDDWIATYAPWGFRLADVSRPVDIWWGDADRLTTRIHTDCLTTGLTRVARVHVVAGAGHSIASTHWAEILASLLERGARA